MSAALIQFNSGDHNINGQNIAESVHTDGDIVFNESYIVVGDTLEAKKVYATYDLTVLGDLSADLVVVNGSLLVNGDIDAESLTCHGKFICTGEVRVKELIIDRFSVADSVVCDTIEASSDLFIRTTVDTNKVLNAEGLLVAAEGIMGAGTFSAKAAIANEFFEFDGQASSKVFEISSMSFSEEITPQSATPVESTDSTKELDLGDIILLFKDSFETTSEEWCELDEDELINNLFSLANAVPDVGSIKRIVDRIADISYLNKITNLLDYLYIIWAKEIFPDALLHYETLEGVFGQLFEDAHKKPQDLEFFSSTVKGLSDALYVLSVYHRKLSIPFEDCADKIFSSIGLRYSTVKRAMEGHQ